MTLRASFWKVLPPSSPGAQARPVSLGRGELAIAFGVPKWGRTSYPAPRPLVVVWLLILASRTLTRVILGTRVAGRHPHSHVQRAGGLAGKTTWLQLGSFPDAMPRCHRTSSPGARCSAGGTEAGAQGDPAPRLPGALPQPKRSRTSSMSFFLPLYVCLRFSKNWVNCRCPSAASRKVSRALPRNSMKSP